MSWTNQAREDLADAVVAMAEFSDPLKVSVLREWVPYVELEKVEKLEVHIAPQARRTAMSGRGYRQTSVDVSVAILFPLNQGQESAQAETGQAMVDAIIDGLLGKRIGGTNNMICMVAEQTVTTSVQHWRELRAFATFLTLTLET